MQHVQGCPTRHPPPSPLGTHHFQGCPPPTPGYQSRPFTSFVPQHYRHNRIHWLHNTNVLNSPIAMRSWKRTTTTMAHLPNMHSLSPTQPQATCSNTDTFADTPPTKKPGTCHMPMNLVASVMALATILWTLHKNRPQQEPTRSSQFNTQTSLPRNATT